MDKVRTITSVLSKNANLFTSSLENGGIATEIIIDNKLIVLIVESKCFCVLFKNNFNGLFELFLG